MAGENNTGNSLDMFITENPDGSVVIDDPHIPAPSTESGAGEGSQVVESGEQRTDGEHADEPIGGDLNDAEREAIRERRRQERQNKKQAQREREQGYQQELAVRDRQLNEMRERLAAVESHNAAAQLAQLDTHIERVNGAVGYYKGMIAEATKKQDGRTVADATQKMLAATQESERLRSIKQHVATNQTSRAPVLDASVQQHASSWMSTNSWYDPSGKDEDSDVVLTIDKRLAAEGFDPRQPTYWSELSKRVAKYLPHRANSSYTAGANASNGKPNRTPVAGSGRESGAGDGSRSSGSTYQLSAARVQALKDAGTWSDPKARAEAIRRYRDYDRQQTANGDRS